MLPHDSFSLKSSVNQLHWTRHRITLLQSWVVAILLGVIGFLCFSPAQAGFFG
jgi:hypothetical protein